MLTRENNKQILLLLFWGIWGCFCKCGMVYNSNSNDLLKIYS